MTHTAHYACYRRGCRRNECRTADRIYRKRYELRRLEGIPSHISGPVVASHIRLLVDSGHTIRGIAKRAKVSERAIYYIIDGQKNVTLGKARALLAVQPLQEPPRVSPVCSIRRVQALAFIGWPVEWTAAQVGIHPSYLFGIIGGRLRTIPRYVEQRVAALYREYSYRPGPSEHVRSIARRNGWHGPLAWDDISDPAAEPEVTEPYEAYPKFERDPDRKAEIAHLNSLGESVAAIAKQLGNSEKYVRDQLTAIQREQAKAAGRAMRSDLREAA